MPEFYVFGRIPHGTGRVIKQQLLLFCCHDTKQFAQLLKVVIVILVKRPVLAITLYTQRRLLVVGLGLPLPKAVGLIVRDTAVVTIYTTLAIPVVTHDVTARVVDRKLMTGGA